MVWIESVSIEKITIQTFKDLFLHQGPDQRPDPDHDPDHTKRLILGTIKKNHVYTYVYAYAFEVKNRIPCMSLLTTRLLRAAQFWLRPVPAKFCIFLCARIAQAPRKLCARQPVFDSKGTSASNHSCIKPAIASLAHNAHMHARRLAKLACFC